MVRSSIPNDQQDEIMKLHALGLDITEIAKKVNVSYIKVYRHIRQEQRKQVAQVRSSKPWTDDELEELLDIFEDYPTRWRETQAFMRFCLKWNRSESACQAVIVERGTWPVIQTKKRKMARPAPVYTNSSTPYGIASELHAGNRIYK